MIDFFFLRDGICHGCREERAEEGRLCGSCRNKLQKIGGRKKIAGAPLYFPYLYRGVVKEWIRRYKFSGEKYLYRLLADLVEDDIRALSPDVLTTVPVTKRKFRLRGYFPTELIVEELSERTGIPYRLYTEKVRETRDQHLLSPDEKRKNLSEAFRLKEEPKGEILLFDDVVTSGATMEEVYRTMGKPEGLMMFSICSMRPTVYDYSPEGKYIGGGSLT